MWQSLVGAGTLVERDGRVLMVLRKRSGKVRWELPSGLLEGGESLEEAAARETLEETSVPVAVGELLCTVVMIVASDGYRGINAYFSAKPRLTDVTPTPQDSDEPILKADFVDVTSLPVRDIHPVDRRILARWKRRTSAKSFYFSIML